MLCFGPRLGVTSLLALALPAMIAGPASAQVLTDAQELGKSIFFDEDLSINLDQSCASCHDPEVGFTGPLADINAFGAVYEGSVPGRFGNRKPPSAAYATVSPIFHFAFDGKREEKGGLFVGGNFWDGRATGETLGNPAADQAQGPFLNPVEQGLPDSACVVYRICTAAYPVAFQDVYGADACAIAWPADVGAQCAAGDGVVGLSEADRAKVQTAFDQTALAIAAYEASPEVNAYSSKYDYYLAGLADLTREEKLGLNLFKGKGKCANCHILDPGPNGEPPLLTDFTFDNLGTPRNPDNPWYDMTEFNPYGFDWIDLGLGGFLAARVEYQHLAEDNLGKQKVPTLRNVDKRPYPGFVKAFTHNGYFKSLKGVVHFYNTRDVKPRCADPFTLEADALALGCWPEPEVDENVNDDELGDLHLHDWQEDAIVEFLKTLSDGYMPPD